MKNLFKFWPFIFIVIIWFIFAAPYFLKHKVPYPSSYQVNNFAVWDAYPGFGSPVKNGAMPDIISQIYPWRHFSIQSLKSGIIPLWNPYSFAGTPHLANYQSAVFAPMNFLFFIFSFVDAWTLLILLQPLLAGIFMYFYIRSLHISKFGSLVSSIAFMFCGFITTWMGYGTLGYAILFLPLALFAVEKYFQKKSILSLILVSITVPFSFFSGHFQISIYFFAFLLLYVVYKGVTEKQFKTAFFLYSAILSGLLISCIQILPSIEFYTQALRSTIFKTGEVIPWQYLPTFLAPDFYGNPVTRNDWFGHYAEWNAYIGVLPFMLAFYALKSKKKIVNFLFVISIATILLCFPTPIMDLIFSLKIPVLSTSAASRIIVLFSFIFTVLAGFGFDTLKEELQDIKTSKYFIIWIGGFTGVFILLWSIVLHKLWLPLDKVVIAKQNLILPSFLFAVSIGTILAIKILKLGKKKWLLIGVSILLVLIVAFDMLRFVTKWMPFDDKSLVYRQVPIAREFAKMLPQDRVVANFGAETCVYYELGCLGGYDPLYINSYGQFIDFMRTGRTDTNERSVVTFQVNNKNTFKAMQLLGVDYVVHKRGDDNAPWTFPYWNYPSEFFPLVYQDEGYKVYKNTSAYPRAFFASSYLLINSTQKALETIFSKNFDPRTTIILEKNPGFAPTKLKQNKTEIVSYTPNKIIIRVTSNTKGLLFLSDPYYPGWKAYVDGKQVSIFQADYAFRAVVVPQGVHTVVFSYFPMSFQLGLISVAIGVGLLFILLKSNSVI